MKINLEQLAKIVEEEVREVLNEVWMPGQTMDKIAGEYSKLAQLKTPLRSKQVKQQEPVSSPSDEPAVEPGEEEQSEDTGETNTFKSLKNIVSNSDNIEELRKKMKENYHFVAQELTSEELVKLEKFLKKETDEL